VSNHISDGAVVYLNGAEVRRLRLPDGPLGYSTLATGSPARPGEAEVFSVPVAALVVGQNLLEVEVHAAAATPQALAFGLGLFATDRLAPSIEDPALPVDRSVVEGTATTFSAGRVLGTEPLSYQWFIDGIAIPGATNATYTNTIGVVLATDAGSYSVEISNATGIRATSRSALLTTTAIPVAFVDPSQPADRTITEGEATTFSVNVTGSPTLYYRWFKGGVPIEGATAAQYAIDDWTNIPVAHSEPQDTLDGFEFKDISVANDDDPATGLATAGLGSEMMIENGDGYQQKNGGFNEGVVRDLDFALAPEAKACEFECRISRGAVYYTDNQLVYDGPTLALAFQPVNTSWTAVDTVPQNATLTYTFVNLPPLSPGPLRIRTVNANVELSWTGPGILESRDSLTSGTWATVPNASSPYFITPTGQQRYFRLKL
jgi:hypothetical protein